MVGYIPASAFGQQTIAAQWALSKLSGARGGRTSARRRKRKTKASATSSRRRRRTSRPARLVKGSAAAKRYMAKIRRKRRK